MTFGWQGFQVDHPENWGPVSLTGNFDHGYGRLAAPARLSLQIRWQRSKHKADLSSVLASYRGRLERDARRAKASFTFDTDEDTYRWIGKGQGRGSIFQAADNRIFFLEVIGDRGDSLKPHLNRMLSSFQAESKLWAVLGLRLRLDAKLLRHVFQAGKTQLFLTKDGAAIEATRWGFAQQLFAKHDLIAWAKAALSMEKATATTETCGLRLARRGPLSKTEALVMVQPEENQIIVVKSQFKKESGRPQWDWIA